MAKPDWLKNIEAKKRQIHRRIMTCGDCRHIGTPVKERRWGREKKVMYECAIHPGCYNVTSSILCEDFEPMI